MQSDYLVYPRNTIAVLKKYDFNFQKRFGQNFLIDPLVLSRIIEAAEIGPEDLAVEIGPGIGTMTEALSDAAREVLAVEIDSHLIPILQDTLSGRSNVTILNEDILKVDLSAICTEKKRPLRIVANLPYYITTPIILKLLEEGVPFETLTVMVQREVAERMQSGPESKDYGALSLAIQYYTEPEIVANVPPNCFIPRPRVGSAVIRLRRRKEPGAPAKDPARMFRLIRASFNQRRKTLVNALSNAPELPYSKEDILLAVEKAGFPSNVRGEALSLEEFAKLSDSL